MQEHEKERAQWHNERAALEGQVTSTRAEWQGMLEKALADARNHHQASAQTANLAQQQADRLQQSLECAHAPCVFGMLSGIAHKALLII